jgi:hypothetical protein
MTCTGPPVRQSARMLRHRCSAAALLAAFLLPGCSPGSPAPSATRTNALDLAVQYAQCLRRQGLDVPDPKPGEQIQIRSGKQNKTKVIAAEKACRQYAPKSNADPSDPAVRDWLLKMARCLRKHGLDVSDPEPGQGLGGNIGAKPNDPRFKACTKEVGATPSGSPS